MRVLVKIGGAQLEERAPRAELARALCTARAAGHELIVVHGGGNQIRKVSAAMGIADRYHQGLRVTDAATAEVVLMVLGGSVNRALVAALQAAGIAAVGLTGADCGTFTARRLKRQGADLGWVGEVAGTDPRLVEDLLTSGRVPVIATVAPSADGEPFFNVNADHAAGPLAAAFACDALLFLTDVPGVLDAQDRLLDSLTPADCDALVKIGAIRGGMLPKVEAALMAASRNPKALVKIAPAGHEDAVLTALAEGTGTRFRLHEVRHG